MGLRKKNKRRTKYCNWVAIGLLLDFCFLVVIHPIGYGCPINFKNGFVEKSK